MRHSQATAQEAYARWIAPDKKGGNPLVPPWRRTGGWLVGRFQGEVAVEPHCPSQRAGALAFGSLASRHSGSEPSAATT